jgi:hypothetical protein
LLRKSTEEIAISARTKLHLENKGTKKLHVLLFFELLMLRCLYNLLRCLCIDDFSNDYIGVTLEIQTLNTLFCKVLHLDECLGIVLFVDIHLSY